MEGSTSVSAKFDSMVADGSVPVKLEMQFTTPDLRGAGVKDSKTLQPVLSL